MWRVLNYECSLDVFILPQAGLGDFFMEAAFEPGSAVVVRDLVSRSELNGTRAIVQRFVPGSGRYEVQVDGEQASIALKPVNLVEDLGNRVGPQVMVYSNSNLPGRRQGVLMSLSVAQRSNSQDHR